MKDDLCQCCCGTGEIDREPCNACAGNGWELCTSGRAYGDPYYLAEQAIKKVFKC